MMNGDRPQPAVSIVIEDDLFNKIRTDLTIESLRPRLLVTLICEYLADSHYSEFKL